MPSSWPSTACAMFCPTCDWKTPLPWKLPPPWSAKTATLSHPRRRAGLALASRRFIHTRHRCGNPPARGERADDPAAPRAASRHEIVQQAIDDVLIEHALVAIALQIQLERLQFDAPF